MGILSGEEEVQIVNGQLSVCKKSSPNCQWPVICLQKKKSSLSMASLYVCKRSTPNCQQPVIFLQKKKSSLSMASYLFAKEAFHVVNGHFVCNRSSLNCQWPVYLSAEAFLIVN
jgi:hypothetical protein